MSTHFKQEHFETLLNYGDKEWQSNLKDNVDAQVNLKEALRQLEVWAQEIVREKFPNGYVEKRKIMPFKNSVPMKFKNSLFFNFYPDHNSPKKLSYFVRLACKPEKGQAVMLSVFLGQLDDLKVACGKTVFSKEFEKAKEYLGGEDKFIARLSQSEALSLSLEELTKWAVSKINEFPQYEELRQHLEPFLSPAPEKSLPSDTTDDSAETDGGDSQAEYAARSRSDQPTHEPRNIIYYGPPGTGKTFTLQGKQKEYTDQETKTKRFVMVTFHQSYGYEEFVEGLRPVLENNPDLVQQDNSPSVNIKRDDSQVRYRIKPGVFRELCERARKDRAHKYAIFIDEINRGNISKIFGELITLIEPDKRSGPSEAMVTLPYSGDRFTVPQNVDVIGTMNTADRSLALVDTALRRRFDFEEVMPNPTLLNDAAFTVDEDDAHIQINVQSLLAMLNERIEALYDRDHTIGHAFFWKVKKSVGDNAREDDARWKELQEIFRNKIIPLLQEYFFNDWRKIRLVLGDNSKKEKDDQFVLEEDMGQAALFGRDEDLDWPEKRKRYRLNDKALERPQAYLQIYERKTA